MDCQAESSGVTASIKKLISHFCSQCCRVSRLLKYVLLLCFTTIVSADGIMFYLLFSFWFECQSVLKWPSEQTKIKHKNHNAVATANIQHTGWVMRL